MSDCPLGERPYSRCEDCPQFGFSVTGLRVGERVVWCCTLRPETWDVIGGKGERLSEQD